MAGRHLVNHNGRVTETVVEQIKASDLLKLMEVVKAATGLWNALEAEGASELPPAARLEWDQLGEAMRVLGLTEVPRDAG
jgi:hypothetical protein